MALSSSIEWTDATWNPVTGCDKVSPGCTLCYAERLSLRLQAMANPNYANGFAVRLQPRMLELPLHWRQPRRIFVNSMSDLFHADIPLDYIQRVFDVMRRASWHCFQVLTKRSERLLELDAVLSWPPNVWMGVSVESSDFGSRIDDLRATRAGVRFLSVEPLLGPIKDLDLTNIDWVIVGGESGPGARPMNPAWVVDLLAQCQRAHVPFFFKQWGGVNKTGRLLGGRTWDEMPASKWSPTTDPDAPRRPPSPTINGRPARER